MSTVVDADVADKVINGKVFVCYTTVSSGISEC